MNERNGQLNWRFALQWLVVVAVGTMALLFAAITGLGMTWLLRQETTAPA